MHLQIPLYFTTLPYFDVPVGCAGMRVMNPTWHYWPTFLDVYPNIRLVPKIDAPLLILHVRNHLSWMNDSDQ
jgi:hypothetical protein